MAKFERVTAVLQGKDPDQVPVSAWGHDYLREWSAQGLADATIEAYRRYDWDYIKVNPRASYYAEAWGAVFEASGQPDQSPALVKPGITSVQDLRGIRRVNVSKGPFGEQLEALGLIAAALQGEAPFVQTVFTPLAVISRMSGSVPLVQALMREHPGELREALDAIAETLEDYAAACVQAGAAGLFLATVDWGTANNLSAEEFDVWVRQYDLRILSRVNHAFLNILHVCRGNNHLLRTLDYPVQVLHWDILEAGNPTLAEIAALTDKALMGGVSQASTLLKGNPIDVVREAQIAIAQMGGKRFLLAPGCSVSPLTPEINLRALKEAAAAGIPGGRRRESPR